MQDQQTLVTTATTAGLCVLLGTLFVGMPHLTRRDLFFGVTVPGAFRSTGDARRILLRYRILVVGATLLSLAVAAWAALQSVPWAAEIAPAVLLICMAPFYLVAHKASMAFRVASSGLREASLGRRRESLPGGLVLQSLPILALIAATGWTLVHWDRLPVRLPIRYDLRGDATAWTTLSPAHVFVPPAFLLLACVVLAVSALGILRSPRRVAVGGSDGAREKHYRRGMAGLLLAAEYLVAFIGSTVTLSPLLSRSWVSGLAIATVVLIVTFSPAAIVALVVLARRRASVGQEPSAASAGSGRAPLGDRTPDERWLWGILYVNRDDVALFVPKRFGVGYTLNFGNRSAWLLLALIVVLVVGGILLPAVLR